MFNYSRACILAALFTATSCSSRKIDYSLIDTSDLPTELFRVYQKVGDTIVVDKVILYQDSSLRLLSFSMWFAGRKGTFQRLQINKAILKAQSDSVRLTPNKPMDSWTPLEKEQGLFVQIRPTPNDGEDLSILALRQEVEDEIDNALTSASIGYWTGGDLGPGGGNMLFNTTDIPQAQHAIVRILRAYQIEDSAVIARRVMTAANDWTYEVIYPIDYVGLFNSM